ncbi:MAG: restriction endonuclease subunit S [Thermoanaerobaculia bacterium]|nr:restriction endonuclease subunit S [Thermoanaerobaculia bacterium]
MKGSGRTTLGDCCEIVMGQAPEGSAYGPLGRGWPLIAGAGDFGEGVPAPKKSTSIAPKLSRPGDIILAIRASIGEIVLSDGIYCLGRGVAALRAAEGLDSAYLRHWLTHARPLLESKARGATFKQVDRTAIAELELELLPVAEQRRVAEILDQADALRAKRRAALAQVDGLTQAIFLEMFGDPATNPRRLPSESLGTLIKVRSGEFLPAASMAPNGTFAVLGGNGVNGYHDEFLFEEQQIVIGRVGVYCGCVHVSPQNSWITDNALYVSERSDRLEFVYLASALTFARLNQYASQSGQPLVSGARIYPVEILVPPLHLQRQFASRAVAVDKLKASHRASLAQIDALFASLQHRAFRGEL